MTLELQQVKVTPAGPPELVGKLGVRLDVDLGPYNNL